MSLVERHGGYAVGFEKIQEALLVTREGDRLMTQATGQVKIEIFPDSETKFFPRVIEAEITFVRDAKGQVTQLIPRQGGRDQAAKKIK